MDIYYTKIAPVAAVSHRAAGVLPEEYRDATPGRLAAGLLLRHCLGMSAENPVRYTGAGKPYVEKGRPFSVSYSGSIAVLLTDEQPCGVDVEPLSGAGRREPGEVLMPGELRWLEDQVHNYMTLWTRKEAALKAVGNTGILPASFNCIARSNSVELEGCTVFLGTYASCGNVISWAAQRVGIPSLTELPLTVLL